MRESESAWAEGDEHFRFAITHQKSANDPFGAAVFFYTLLILLHFRVIDSCRAIPSRMEFVLIYDVKKRVAHTLNTTAVATIAHCRLTYIR